MEGLTIKGNVPAGTNSGWTNPLPAVRGEKAIPPSTNKASQVDQAAALAESFKKISGRNREANKALADRLQSFLESSSYSLQFIPSNDYGQVVIKVLDSSGQVIRQIPPEYLARLAEELESATGLLLDETLE